MKQPLRPEELYIVEQFENFLSWNVAPKTVRPPVPPAWYAYALVYSHSCPPRGEM